MENELAKILVERDQDPPLLVSHFQDRPVPRILRPVTYPNCLMSRGLQGVSCAARHARIEQDFQEATSTGKGSIRSQAMTLRA